MPLKLRNILQINAIKSNFLGGLFSLLRNFLITIFACCFLLFTIFPLQVQAQTSGGVIGFKDCDFSTVQQNPDAGKALFGTCLKSVITFIVVISIFVAAIRIGGAALTNLNPLSDGSGAAKTQELLRDLFIGLALISCFGLILSTLNPAALKIDFLDFSELRKAAGLQGGAAKTTGTTTTTGGGNTGGTTGNGGTVASNISTAKVNELVAASKKDPASQTAKDAFNSLKEMDVKIASCQFIFIDSKNQSDCEQVSKLTTDDLAKISSTLGTSRKLVENPKTMTGVVNITNTANVVSVADKPNGKFVVIKYTALQYEKSTPSQASFYLKNCASSPLLSKKSVAKSEAITSNGCEINTISITPTK